MDTVQHTLVINVPAHVDPLMIVEEVEHVFAMSGTGLPITVAEHHFERMIDDPAAEALKPF